MALHETLSAKLNMDIFFCDPHSPWQRGSNENANGLIREFLPKGMDLSLVSHQQLTSIEHALNNRPRKILGFESLSRGLLKTLVSRHRGCRASSLKPPSASASRSGGTPASSAPFSAISMPGVQ